jgi:flavin reductase (DIM6/NTAB) family NADH-FMN oxidoreductase RutF
MEVASHDFRNVLSGWASGVAILTSRAGDRLYGITITAFSAVSLDPPLVLVCVNAKSPLNEIIAESKMAAISILNAGQREISDLFAGSGNAGLRFDRCEHHPGEGGMPLIDGALGHLECGVQDVLRSGDHMVYIVAPRNCAHAIRDPLLYFRGQYQELIYGRRSEERGENK